MRKIFGIFNPTGHTEIIEHIANSLASASLSSIAGTGPSLLLASDSPCGPRIDRDDGRGLTILFAGRRARGDSVEQAPIEITEDPMSKQNPKPEELNCAFTHISIPAGGGALSLAIDRFGQHRLAYTQTRSGELVFASGIELLKCHPDVNTEPDLQAIFHYLFFHVVPSPGSIYKSIHKLPPAHQLRFDGQMATISRYWSPRFASKLTRPRKEAQSAIVPLVKSAVKRSGTSPQTGAFLSGGLDSSTVCGSLQSFQNSPTKAFSVGFAAEGFDEIKYARAAARHFGLDHKVHYITPREIAEALPLVAQAYDEPFGNSSAVPTYVCARLAKSHGIDLLLGGDGGDEIFSGNTRYLKQKLFEGYFSIPSFIRKGFLEPLFASRGKHDRTERLAFRKITRYIDQALVPLPDRLETYNLLQMIALEKILAPDFQAAIDPEQSLQLLRDEWHAIDNVDSQDKMLFLDWKFTLADNDLRKVTEMTNLAGVDVAYPLLDNEIVEFATSIPASVRIPNGKLRHFYKESVRSFLPPETLSKSKHGFGLPFGDWARTDPGLREIVMDSISSLGQRRLIRNEFLSELGRQHMTDHAQFYGNMVWVLMMLELWMEAHNINP